MGPIPDYDLPINRQMIAKDFSNFAKAAKFRQIWSRWLHLARSARLNIVVDCKQQKI